MGSHQPVGALDEAELLALLKRASAHTGGRAWVVGGYVRDKLLGRPHANPDVVVEGGDALVMAKRFAELAHAGPPVTFERFGTAQVTAGERLVEFVTARAESYPSDSRKPRVTAATIDEDLRRRDLTINTLLMDLDGKIEDRLGAMADLNQRILRTPADPLKTFSDDPLRMLRLIRFAADLGFDPAPDVLPAMRQMRERVAPPVISIERVSEELRRILVSERPKLGLELLDAGGLLEVVLPELSAYKGVAQGGFHTHDVYGHTLLTVAAAPPDLLIRLAAVLHDVGKPATATADGAFTGHEMLGAELARGALERLRFPQNEIDAVVLLIRLHLRPVFYESEWTDGAVRRLARDAGPQLPRMMALARADIAASAYPDGHKLDQLQARLDKVLAEQPSRIAPVVTGEEIMRVRDLTLGPEVGRIKERLQELVIDGVIAPDRAAVIDYLRAHPEL